jgi:epoxide hydrolase 4
MGGGGELREGYAEVGDQRLHYVEAGEGPLVILLHGFPEFWFGWRLQIQPLAAAGFRVVAPDMRGYNLSSKPNGVHAYDTDKLTDDIRGLIHERGAESALLVGHDWGGTVAWDTAMSHPEVVERLAILNVAHPRQFLRGLHHPGQLRKSWYVFFFDLPELPEAVVHANDWHFFRHFLRDARPAYTSEELERYIEAWSQPGAAAGMINYYRNAARQSPKHVEAQVRPISAPTLLIWGQDDRYLGPTWPSLTTTMYPAWIVSSSCPAPHTGSTTTSMSASTSCSSTSSPLPCQPGTRPGDHSPLRSAASAAQA